jgi:DNA-binding GntR family transcriptional regulator
VNEVEVAQTEKDRDSTTARRGGNRPFHAQRAYAEIKRRILDNEMPAGFQALEQELAEILEMSRTPVREALIRLANEGMVEVRPRHGMRVLPISADDTREIYEILTSLESTAAALVAARGLAPAKIDSLRQTVADMEEALADDDLVKWAKADERFHRLLVDYAGNARLCALVASCWDQSHRVRMATLRLRPKPTRSNRDHAAVVDAIARGDTEAAGRIHRDHRFRAGQMLVELLNAHGITQL